MTDYQQVTKFLKKLKVPTVIWKDVMYIHSKATEVGATKAIGIRSAELDFNFNKKGKLLGYSTSSINGFYPVKKVTK